MTLLAGVDPTDPLPLSHHQSYMGYLLNLAVFKYIYDETDNDADLVLLLKPKHGIAALPKIQRDYLHTLGFRTVSLKPSVASPEEQFKEHMMDKFEIFRFVEYDRIVFFDADVIPLCRWNYLLELSEQGILAPNLVMSWKREPAQGGFFMIEPNEGDYNDIKTKMPFINETHGFGSPIQGHEEGLNRNYTAWNWYGSEQDQGLLHHWVKYHKKNVSIARKNRVTRWEGTKDGRLRVVNIMDPFPYTCPNLLTIDRNPNRLYSPCNQDHYHYTGGKKPWRALDWNMRDVNSTSPYSLWGDKLYLAWQTYRLPPMKAIFADLNQSYDEDLEKVQKFVSGEVPFRLFPEQIIIKNWTMATPITRS